jgi:hypothetical protein
MDHYKRSGWNRRRREERDAVRDEIERREFQETIEGTS